MRMIPTPGSRVQSSETTGTRSQHTTPTQTTTGSEDPPPLEPEPIPWPPVNNPLPEGEDEDIVMEEELARQAGHVYLRYDGGTQGHDQDHMGLSLRFYAKRCRVQALELGRELTQSEVFARTTLGMRIRIGSTDARMTLVAYEEELKRLQAERQAIIDAGGPEPPPIDEDTLCNTPTFDSKKRCHWHQKTNRRNTGGREYNANKYPTGMN
ncbi:hypothetical protein PIB30_061876 [Stylosanthes scabra]|uniref:Uncharacterized protein n=1 Tax=Stylosanthes scabra TaxID=79078 RepID=A0ABU6RLB9_9FABA|nr:hypothetical protein [Stylosanthes scabra]